MRVGCLHATLAVLAAFVPTAAEDTSGQVEGQETATGTASDKNCAGWDEFTAWGFNGRGGKQDGCYTRSGSRHGLPTFSLNGDQGSGDLIFAARDLDAPPAYAYWTVRDQNGASLCVDFDFNEASVETHPTQVSNWRCQEGGSSSMFTKADFSVVCGCSNTGRRPGGLRAMEGGSSSKRSTFIEYRLVEGTGVFMVLALLWMWACAPLRQQLKTRVDDV